MSRASLAIDEGIKEQLAQDLRAIKLIQDPKRPRWAMHESVPLGPSLKEDFAKAVALLKESEPCAVLVRLKDEQGTVPAGDTDWIIITWVPETLPDNAQQRHLVNSATLREKFLHLRLSELCVGTWMEVSWEAFYEKAKDVIQGQLEVTSPTVRRRTRQVSDMSNEEITVDKNPSFQTAFVIADRGNADRADAAEQDIEMQRQAAVSSLERYSGSSPTAFQPWVIITSCQGYMDALAKRLPGATSTQGSRWKSMHSASEKVSVLRFDMGAPNAALVVDILGRLGTVQLILATGVAGAISKTSDFCSALSAGDIFVPVAAVRAESVSDHYRPVGAPAVPDTDLLQAVLQATGGQAQTGMVYTQNIHFWEHDSALRAKILASTADAVDLETATVFSAASRLGMKAAAMHVITDVPFDEPQGATLAKRWTQELASAMAGNAIDALKAVGATL